MWIPQVHYVRQKNHRGFHETQTIFTIWGTILHVHFTIIEHILSSIFRTASKVSRYISNKFIWLRFVVFHSNSSICSLKTEQQNNNLHVVIRCHVDLSVGQKQFRNHASATVVTALGPQRFFPDPKTEKTHEETEVCREWGSLKCFYGLEKALIQVCYNRGRQLLWRIQNIYWLVDNYYSKKMKKSSLLWTSLVLNSKGKIEAKYVISIQRFKYNDRW